MLRLVGGRLAVLHTPCALGEVDLFLRDSPQELGSLQSSISAPHLWQGKPPRVASRTKAVHELQPQPLPKGTCEAKGTLLGQ